MVDINKYTEKIFDDISNETGKYRLIGSDTKNSREHKIKIMSLYGTNLWLLNNGDEIDSNDDFRYRVDSFSSIVNNPLMNFARKKAHLASCIDEYLKGEVTVGEIIPIFSDNEVTFSERLDLIKLSSSSYNSAVEAMRKLKDDPEVQQKASVCHYQFYTDSRLKQMSSAELYVALAANELMLSRLNEISSDMAFEKKDDSGSFNHK